MQSQPGLPGSRGREGQNDSTTALADRWSARNRQFLRIKTPHRTPLNTVTPARKACAQSNKCFPFRSGNS